MRDGFKIVAVLALLVPALLVLSAGVRADSDNAGLASPSVPESTRATAPNVDVDPPPTASVLDPARVQAILGQEIRTMAGKSMGRVVDVIVDHWGEVRAVVVDFGGFLGVGSRKIAVDWSILRFGEGEKSDRVAVNLTRNQVRSAPEFKPGKPIIVLGSASAMTPAETSSAPSR